MRNKLLSVIVPCYNEELSIPLFIEEIRKTEKIMKDKYSLIFEYIFVDDGSKDKTAEILKDLAKEDSKIKYIIFSRNFGKESAFYAGLSKCRGDFAVVMDADLQDPPRMIEDMYLKVKDGEYDCAGARRVTRKGEPPIRSFFARMFYKVINKISQTKIVDGARDFRIMRREMVDAILSMKEYYRFSKGIFSWVGFRTYWFEYENAERVAGETKWSFYKLLLYSIEGIIAFSTVPLAFSFFFGILFMIVSIVLLGVLIFIPTGTICLISILFMLASVNMIGMGIMSQYLSKTYMESKKRPIYIEREDNLDE